MINASDLSDAGGYAVLASIALSKQAIAPIARMKQAAPSTLRRKSTGRAITYSTRIGRVLHLSEPEQLDHRLRKQKHIISCRGPQSTCLREALFYFKAGDNAAYASLPLLERD